MPLNAVARHGIIAYAVYNPDSENAFMSCWNFAWVIYYRGAYRWDLDPSPSSITHFFHKEWGYLLLLKRLTQG